MKLRLLFAVVGFLLTELAVAKEHSLKIYDKPGSRAVCPDGYRELGRFAEMKQGKARGGMECQKDARAVKPPAKPRSEGRSPGPAVPPNTQNLPEQLTLEEKDGQAPQCPEGYQQTGTFSNMTYANGKLDKRAGIYCSRTAGTSDALPPGESL